MINPNKVEKCNSVGKIINIELHGHYIEQVEVRVDKHIIKGFTSNFDVYNKYGYKLKNKRLNKERDYKVYCKFSIMADAYIIYLLQEL